jgi:hypothetical protein
MRRIWGSHSTGYEEYYILGCNAVESVESQPTFQENTYPPSSGRRISQADNKLGSCFHALFLLDLYFEPEDGGNISFRNICWLSTNFFFTGAKILYGSWPPPLVSNSKFFRVRFVSPMPNPQHRVPRTTLHLALTFDLYDMSGSITSVCFRQHSSPGHWCAQTSSPR